MPWFRKLEPCDSPVLVVDALGVSHRIETLNAGELSSLADELDAQFHQFRAKVPHRLVLVTKRRVIGSGEFSTLRLNDMFVLFSERPQPEPALRYLTSASLLYHQLLVTGFLPRGGLGFGPILRRRDMVLGAGFLDAYRVAESRPEAIRNVCAFALSHQFLANVPKTERACRLLCLYKDCFFINPRFLIDPDMGEFDNSRILDLLDEANVNSKKRDATADFLDNLEDYDAARLTGSRSRSLAGWIASEQQ